MLCPNGRDSDRVGRTCENEREFAGGDFAGVNAPGITLPDDISGADFGGANLTAARLTGTYLADANLLSANLTDATISNLSADDLAGTNMGVASLERATLNSVDLRGVAFFDANTTDLFVGEEVCFDETTVWNATVEPSESKCDDAEARITLAQALFATDADELLALLESPTGFEYLTEYFGPNALFPNGLNDFVEPPPRRIVASGLEDEEAKELGFSLVLKEDIAALFADPTRADEFYVYDGAVSWSITLVPVDSEWRLGSSSFCGFLVRLEVYFQVVVGSAIPNRTPLDACVATLPQAAVGTPQLADG